jgi:hypothetical protein
MAMEVMSIVRSDFSEVDDEYRNAVCHFRAYPKYDQPGDYLRFHDGVLLPSDYGDGGNWEWIHDDRHWPDMVESHSLWMLVSGRFRSVIEQTSRNPSAFYQFLKPRFLNFETESLDRGYVLLNILDHRDCVDLERSNLVLNDRKQIVKKSSGTQTGIERATFYRDDVVKADHLFRASCFSSYLLAPPIVSEALVNYKLNAVAVSPIGMPLQQG